MRQEGMQDACRKQRLLVRKCLPKNDSIRCQPLKPPPKQLPRAIFRQFSCTEPLLPLHEDPAKIDRRLPVDPLA